MNMDFERFGFPREIYRGCAAPKSNALTQFLSDDRLANFPNNVYTMEDSYFLKPMETSSDALQYDTPRVKYIIFSGNG